MILSFHDFVSSSYLVFAVLAHFWSIAPSILRMSKHRAVIFDMDGVIVNSEPLHERAFYQVVEDLGYGQNHGIRVSDYIGRTDAELWMAFMAKHRPVQTLEDLLALKRKNVLNLLQKADPIFSGLPELLAKLAARYPLALASGSERPFIEAVLDLKHLRRVFSFVGQSAGGARRETAPRTISPAARPLFGVAPQRLVGHGF